MRLALTDCRQQRKKLMGDDTLYFDYDLQVWVRDNVILDCGHINIDLKTPKKCCNAGKYAGRDIREFGGKHE